MTLYRFGSLKGHPWNSSGGPVIRTRRFHCQTCVQSLVRELRSHKLHGVAKKKKKREDCFIDGVMFFHQKSHNIWLSSYPICWQLVRITVYISTAWEKYNMNHICNFKCSSVPNFKKRIFFDTPLDLWVLCSPTGNWTQVTIGPPGNFWNKNNFKNIFYLIQYSQNTTISTIVCNEIFYILIFILSLPSPVYFYPLTAGVCQHLLTQACESQLRHLLPTPFMTSLRWLETGYGGSVHSTTNTKSGIFFHLRELVIKLLPAHHGLHHISF